MTQKSALLLFGSAAALALAGLAIAHDGPHGPPPKATFAPHNRATPFELFRGNRIIVTARINGHETRAMLDTGASMTTVDRSYARSIGMPEGTKVAGRGTGGMVEAEIVPGVDIDVGGLKIEQTTVGVMDLTQLSKAIGRPFTVILGRDLFNSAVISIDWASNLLTLTAPDRFQPAAGASRIELGKNGPFNTIPVSVMGAAPINALFDLGSGGALSLPRTYWGDRPELSSLKAADSVGGGVGGLHTAHATLIPEVALAGRSFTAVPTLLFDGGNDHEPTQMANVGIGLLKQFKLDLDLGHDRIYLAPRRDAPPFDRDRAGVRFDLMGDRLKAVFVSPQGPAAAAGLKAGDEITAIDGRQISPSYYEAPDWTKAAAGKKVVLVRADGSKVTITLADYY